MAEDSGTRFMLDAIYHGGQGLQMDFKDVAKLHGISHPSNARRKFQDNLKVYGYKYDFSKGGLVKLDGSETPDKMSKKVAANGQKAGGKKSTAKKRKLDDAASEGGEDTTEDKASKNGEGSGEDKSNE